MLMKGSCHCGAVSFEAECHTPYLFMHCYCSICRKTSGGGGYSINLKAEYDTLQISGEEHMGIYQAWMDTARTGLGGDTPGQRVRPSLLRRRPACR